MAIKPNLSNIVVPDMENELSVLDKLEGLLPTERERIAQAEVEANARVELKQEAYKLYLDQAKTNPLTADLINFANAFGLKEVATQLAEKNPNYLEEKKFANDVMASSSVEDIVGIYFDSGMNSRIGQVANSKINLLPSEERAKYIGELKTQESALNELIKSDEQNQQETRNNFIQRFGKYEVDNPDAPGTKMLSINLISQDPTVKGDFLTGGGLGFFGEKRIDENILEQYNNEKATLAELNQRLVNNQTVLFSVKEQIKNPLEGAIAIYGDSARKSRQENVQDFISEIQQSSIKTTENFEDAIESFEQEEDEDTSIVNAINSLEIADESIDTLEDDTPSPFADLITVADVPVADIGEIAMSLGETAKKSLLQNQIASLQKTVSSATASEPTKERARKRLAEKIAELEGL